MNSKYIIFAGAHIDDYVWLGQQINENDTVICADSGTRHAQKLGITPDIIIGDFDSIGDDLLSHYKDKCKIIHDDDQNATDLMKALAQCTSPAPIEIFGAIGERADHDFSNYLILMNLDSPDRITLCTKNETRRVVKSSCSINGHIGDHVGVFPLSKIEKLQYDGLKYPADCLGTSHEFGWNGACNEMMQRNVSISFSSGILLITHSY